MAAPIGPGDWVEFVGGKGGGTGKRRPRTRIEGSYTIGQLFLVEAVNPAIAMPDGRVVPGLRLRGIRVISSGQEAWCPAYQWRPIYRPRADFIQSLKAPPINAPARVSEDA